MLGVPNFKKSMIMDSMFMFEYFKFIDFKLVCFKFVKTVCTRARALAVRAWANVRKKVVH
jgi:hypothetical protein